MRGARFREQCSSGLKLAAAVDEAIQVIRRGVNAAGKAGCSGWRSAIELEVQHTKAVNQSIDESIVIDAPDDETLAKFQLATGALGNIRTETLRAFSEEEYRRIIAALP